MQLTRYICIIFLLIIPFQGKIVNHKRARGATGKEITIFAGCAHYKYVGGHLIGGVIFQRNVKLGEIVDVLPPLHLAISNDTGQIRTEQLLILWIGADFVRLRPIGKGYVHHSSIGLSLQIGMVGIGIGNGRGSILHKSAQTSWAAGERAAEAQYAIRAVGLHISSGK